MGNGNSSEADNLFKFVLCGDYAAVDQLLKKGADPEERFLGDWTALHAAAYHGNKEIIELLIKKNADVNAVNGDGHTPAYLALQANFVECATLLVNEGGRLGADLTTLWAKVLTISTREESKKPLIDLLLASNPDSVNDENEHGRPPLHEACNSGLEVTAVHLMSATNIDVRKKDRDGLTAMHYAARRNSVKLVSKLKGKGADINARDKEGNTPAFHAVKEGHADILRYMFTLRPSCAGQKNNDQWSALHVAALHDAEECVDVCIKNGEDVDACTKHMSSPLHVASARGHVTLMRRLVSAQANCNAVNDAGMTPLHKAILHVHVKAVRFLLESGADPTKKTLQAKWTPLHIACFKHEEAIVKMLVEGGARLGERDTYGMTPLDLVLTRTGRNSAVAHYLIDMGANQYVNKDATGDALKKAERQGDADRAQILRRAVSEINEPYDKLITEELNEEYEAAMAAEEEVMVGPDGKELRSKDASLLRAARAGDLRLAETVLEEGADITATTAKGESALFLSILHGHDIVTALLVGKDAKLKHDQTTRAAESKATNGTTFLHRAIIRGEDARVEILVAAYDSLEYTDKNGDTALHLAAAMNSETYTQQLVKSGAVLDARNHHGQTPLHKAIRSPGTFRFLVMNRAAVDHRDVSGKTALMYLAETADLEKMTFVLGGGAQADAVDMEGKDALMYLCQHATDTTSALDVKVDPLKDNRVQCARLLLDRKVNVNRRCAAGAWAQLYAVRASNTPLVQFLAAHGSDPQMRTAQGDTALDVARATNLAIAAVLESVLKAQGLQVPSSPARAPAAPGVETMLLEWEEFKTRVVRLEAENAKLKQEVRTLRQKMVKTTARAGSR